MAQARRFTLTDSDFVSGRDDDSQVSAGVVAEVATAQVGPAGDGQLTNYREVQLGTSAAAPGEPNTPDNTMFVKLQAGGSDIADTAEFAFAAKFVGDLGGGPEGEITGFRSHRGQDQSDPRQRTKLPPQEPTVPAGIEVQLLAKDETANLTVDLSESTFQIPSVGMP